jgi:TolA-binding protein
MLLNVVKEAKEMNGAEAQYLIAKMLYRQGKFNESQAACHVFNNQLASFTKRYNKTCRLLADNYLGLKQTYLAHATLKSIIDNAKDNQTRKLARQKLACIKSGSKETV